MADDTPDQACRGKISLYELARGFEAAFVALYGKREARRLLYEVGFDHRIAKAVLRPVSLGQFADFLSHGMFIAQHGDDRFEPDFRGARHRVEIGEPPSFKMPDGGWVLMQELEFFLKPPSTLRQPEGCSPPQGAAADGALDSERPAGGPANQKPHRALPEEPPEGFTVKKWRVVHIVLALRRGAHRLSDQNVLLHAVNEVLKKESPNPNKPMSTGLTALKDALTYLSGQGQIDRRPTISG